MTSVLNSVPTRREMGLRYSPRSSRYDNHNFTPSAYQRPSVTTYGNGPSVVGCGSSRSFLTGRRGRSVSLHRPLAASNFSVLDEIIDRKRITLKSHLDDVRYSNRRNDSDAAAAVINGYNSRGRTADKENGAVSDQPPETSTADDYPKSEPWNGLKIEEISDCTLLLYADQVKTVSACPIVTFGDDDEPEENVNMETGKTDQEGEHNMVNNDEHQDANSQWHCSKCKDKCTGFKPHRWRAACDFCKCPSSSHRQAFALNSDEQQFLSTYLMEKPTTKKIRSLFSRDGSTSTATTTTAAASSAVAHTATVNQPIATVIQPPLHQATAAVNSAKHVAASTAATVTVPPATSNTAGAGTNGPKHVQYMWTPPGLPQNKVDEYMSQLPNHKVPRTGTVGEKYREKQLMLQLPRQDLAASYCKHLTGNQEQAAFEEFVNIRNESALDIGFVCASIKKSMECHKCRGLLASGELAVMAPKLPPGVGWHPSCFVCAMCDELLVDLTYCVNREEKIFCERHYAETVKPRCGACDELIFAGEYTKAMNQDWHSNHFCCWQCDQVLTGQRYILRDDHPYCIKCYEEVFANTCDECGKAIGIDSKDLSYKEKHWHESCFLCSMCKISLVDKSFGTKNDRIFCANCYDQAFATRCDGCGEIFRAGMKKMEYKGKQWHDKCFCCALCKSPIGTRSFIPKNEEVYCAGCYEEKFATRCTKCRKVINSGGVTYKNEPWHRECFCCRNCNVSLAGQRFTSKDDKPYCATCFGELFAKRCTLCTKPITGIGGSKFISFEERHWHNSCFVCAQCETSLVGQGFITDGPDILCPECAKARLFFACSANQS